MFHGNSPIVYNWNNLVATSGGGNKNIILTDRFETYDTMHF